ncbi:ribulose-phosphate 3-epimerase [Spiroplasma helicoides]|uniref:Ribulose-phosphate 3-epimerase n=1 Tax=Spiroplasma helicoides TaxID=216938 RepID=A0A1B3SLB5_9MOLU|nr:ribulose-phosphate 3-epimerase [Spiroplasma helicoides]AOG60725.1 ribulose-phosphate 3-epimerase [Spiroplasma helicoides]
MSQFIVAPSILTANFLKLSHELDRLKKAGINWIHYDVMDYNFVPNLSFGPSILKNITDNYDFKIDVHLMVKINNSTIVDYLKPFLQKNVFQITMHYESIENKDVQNFISFCKSNNIKASMAISPDTTVEQIENHLSQLDNVLVMSVYPGFGGQKFIEKSIKKIEKLKRHREENNWAYTIEVDGGINQDTYHLVQKAGIDMIVAGSYLVSDIDEVELRKRVMNLEN